MTVKRKCAGRWKDYRSIWGACSRPATVEREGKWYCWQHDPIRAEADKKKRWAICDAKIDRATIVYKRRALNAKLAALVNEETAALLERLARYANLYDAPESAYNARALAARIRQALAQEGDDAK